MAPDGNSFLNRADTPAAGPSQKRTPTPPGAGSAAAAPDRQRGVPLTRPKQQVHKHQSYATLRKLEAELLLKQRQLTQLEQQHDQLCQNVQVMQQIVVSGQDVLAAAASHVSTLSSSQRQRQAALDAGLEALTEEEALLHRMYRSSTKASIQATDAPGFARLLSAATCHGKQLLEEGGLGSMQQGPYQRWAGALLALQRACLTWNPDAFWGAASINLSTMQQQVPGRDHWRQVVAHWVDTATPEQIGVVLGNQRFLHKSMDGLTQRLHSLVATLTTTQDFYCHYHCSQELGRVLQEHGSARLLYGAHFAAGLGVCEFGRFAVLSWPYMLSVSGVGEALAELAPAAASSGPRALPRLPAARRRSPRSEPGSSGSPSSAHHQQAAPWEGGQPGGDQGQTQISGAEAMGSGQHTPSLLPLLLPPHPPGPAATAGGGVDQGAGAGGPGGLELLLQPSPAAAILQELSGRAVDALKRQLRQEQVQQVQLWQGQLQQVAADYLQMLVTHLCQRRELWSDSLRPADAHPGGSSVQEGQAAPSAQPHQHHNHQLLQPPLEQQQELAGGAEAGLATQAGASSEAQLHQMLDLETGHLSVLADLLFCCRGVLAAPQYQQLAGAAEVVAALEEQFVACLLEQQQPPSPLR